jgi:hypothetical protein
VADINSSDNPYPFGSGEHLAYEVQNRFGEQEAAFCLWVMSRYTDGNISTFLTDFVERFGLPVAEFVAIYLEAFETMPNVSEATKQRVILAFLDFDENNDPDLGRFKD